MNRRKVGEPYAYPNLFVKLLGYMRAYFHLPYRQTEGVVKAHAGNMVPSIPHYISRRVNRLDIRINESANNETIQLRDKSYESKSKSYSFFLSSVICCSLIASEVDQVEEDRSPVCGDST